jgi:hypothetical protein
MTAKVIDLSAARLRRRPEITMARTRFEPNGDLVVCHVRDDGAEVTPITIPDRMVDELLARLVVKRRKLRDERLYQARPDLRPAAPKPCARPTWARCKRGRDGGCRGTCRRRERHEGPCRDASGDFVPAICSHIGRARCRVVSEAGAIFSCSHCGALV